MDIDKLTYGEMKEIARLFYATRAQEEDHPAVGKFCILRCHDAGVHAGIVEKVLPGDIVMKNSRRMYQWHSKFTLSEAAIHGIDPEKSKIAEVVPLNFIRRSDACEIIPCSEVAKDTIMGAKNANQ